ncbi:MAG: SpoIIE family protein phosphatase [Lachnospiraceae bacterium]|nr:SpoIIE family protein phosphatase [Lachnospiraceae bacterium]
MKPRLKNLIVHGAGLAMAPICIYGCYPLGISYFAALSMAYGDWYFIFPLVLLGMAAAAPILSVVKYGVAMILCVILSGIVEERKGICSKGQMAFICGSSIFAMTLTEYFLFMKDLSYLYYGMAEGVFAASLTVIFYQTVLLFIHAGEKPEQEEKVTVLDAGRNKLKESAQVLSKLSSCFGEMPDKKEVLTKQDVEEMFQELSQTFCSSCEKCHDCWQNHYFDTYKNTYDVFHAIENDGAHLANGEMALSRQCINYKSLTAEMKRIFNKTKTNMLWYNRIIESRSAVAVQLSEMAKMMGEAAEEIYHPKVVEDGRRDQIRKKLKNHHIITEDISIIQKKNKEEIYMTMHVDWKKCVAVREIGIMISEICQKAFVPEQDSRMLVGRESTSVLFVEDTTFRIVHGVARVAKTGERISGDNFSVLFSDDGQMTASLSDGMGTGIRANKESEMIIELLERFLEAGFCKETALGMMNATLVMNDQNGRYSTVDVVSVDLHDGSCEFVKLGASYTFIKREHVVETIQMESMPIGLFQKQQLVKTERKLEDGDYIIMVSDGVLAPIPEEEQVKVMENLLLEMEQVNPKDMANAIMEKMLRECGCDPKDDMTVLVFGVWKK